MRSIATGSAPSSAPFDGRRHPRRKAAMFASLTCDSPLASAEKLPRRYPCFAQWSQTARHTNRAVSTLTKARAVTRTRRPRGPPTKAERTSAKHPTGAPRRRAHRASYRPSGGEKPSPRVPNGTRHGPFGRESTTKKLRRPAQKRCAVCTSKPAHPLAIRQNPR